MGVVLLVSTDLPITVDTEAATARQAARLENIPEVYRGALERLCIELALHMEAPDEVFASHHYTPEQAAELVESPAFIAMLERVTKDVREQGLSFRHKAKAISEEVLPIALDMMTDTYISAAVRADLIKWVAKVAGNEPKEKDEGRTGGGLTLSITFAGQAPQQVVTGAVREPITIEGN